MNFLPAAHAADKLEIYLNEKISQIHPFGIDLQRVVGVFLAVQNSSIGDLVTD